MEGKITRFLKNEIQEINNLTEDFLCMFSNHFGDNQIKAIKISVNLSLFMFGLELVVEDSKHDEQEADIQKKNTKELVKEEEKLKLHLCQLKKENFTLQTSINAWQKTLKKKLEEFKEAGLKLDKIYAEIWAEREKFCLEADEFNYDYGIFSDWWKTQMNFLSDLENLGKKRSDDQKCKEEIEKLEKEIEEIKREIEVLQDGKEPLVHSTEDANFPIVRSEDMTREISPQKLDGKRKTNETDCEIIEYEEIKTVQNDLFSMVDVEKVRKVNRNRNRRRALLGKVKALLTH